MKTNSNKSKVMFLFQLPPPIHGASTVNEAICKSISIRETFETKFIDISTSKDLKHVGKFGLKKILITLNLIKKTFLKYRSFKPDLVYITLSPVGFAFLKDSIFVILIKIMGGNVVIHFHGKGIRKYTRKSNFWLFLYKTILKKVHIIQLSPVLFKDVENIRDKKCKLFAVPNGIKFKEMKSNLSKNKVFTFIYLSNLVPDKGADLLIKASSLIPEFLQHKFQVFLVGEESDANFKKDIDRLISQNKYGNIKLLKPSYGDEKFRLLLSSMVFVLPTKNDCFPLSIIEAMASGLAVISTDEGAIAEIIDDGKTGKIIKKLEPQILAKSMKKYIDDMELASSHGKKGQERYQKYFTNQNFEINLIDCLNKLV